MFLENYNSNDSSNVDSDDFDHFYKRIQMKKIPTKKIRMKKIKCIDSFLEET